MKPKGHKRGCKCVVCGRKPARRNAGYENQMNTLHDKAAAGRTTRRNSAVRIAGNPGHSKRETLPSGVGIEVRERKNQPGTYSWTIIGKSGKSRLPGPGTIEASTPSAALRLAVKAWKGMEHLRGAKKKKAKAKANTAHGTRWYIFDLFNGKGEKKGTRIRQQTKTAAFAEARKLMNRTVGSIIVRKVVLSGPYATKPTAKTARR